MYHQSIRIRIDSDSCMRIIQTTFHFPKMIPLTPLEFIQSIERSRFSTYRTFALTSSPLPQHISPPFTFAKSSNVLLSNLTNQEHRFPVWTDQGIEYHPLPQIYHHPHTLIQLYLQMLLPKYNEQKNRFFRGHCHCIKVHCQTGYFFGSSYSRFALPFS